MGGFKEADGVGGVTKGTKKRTPSAVLAWGEAQEREVPHPQAGQCQSGRHRGRARQACHRHSSTTGSDDQREPGIGDGGHAGVCHHQHAPTLLGLLDEELRPLGLVVVEVGVDSTGNLHSQRVRERPGAASILRGHDVCAGQSVDQPHRSIQRIAQRRGRQDDSPLRQRSILGGAGK